MALPKLTIDRVLQARSQSTQNKVIFFDYDGTLTATHKAPEFGKETSLTVVSRGSVNVCAYQD